MMNRKIYACYRMFDGRATDIEFWSFNKSIYDNFVSTFREALIDYPCIHRIVPYTEYEATGNARESNKLDIYDIDGNFVISTSYLIEMFWETDYLSFICSFIPNGRNAIQMLPKHIQRPILNSKWNTVVCEEDVDWLKLYYVGIYMYFKCCEFGEIFGLPKRLI